MAALTGNKIKDSYLGLLKSIDNAPFSPRASGTFVQISDGGGNALPLYLSTSSINFYNAYTFPSADGTVSGQVLSTDANGTLSWVTTSNNQTLEEVLTSGNTTTIAISSSADITTTAQFNGDINGALLQKVKAAEVLSKGDVVYISGGTGDNPQVSKAKADSSTTMPALGIMKENINTIGNEGECITSGELTGVDLTGIATAAELFVSSTTAGELVTTAPTGVTNLIQKIGKVIKGGSGGALTVLGAFRTNALPNLPTGVVVGNGTSLVSASSNLLIASDGTITLYQPNNVPTDKNNYNIGGGNIALNTGGYNTGFGEGNLSQVGFTTGANNSAFGYKASFAMTTGDDNTSVGFSALKANTTGNGNTSIGSYSMFNSNNVYYSTVIGSYALYSNTTGTQNIALGFESLYTNVSGNGNTSLGYRALKVSTGDRNIAVGYGSGISMTTGDNNVIIGSFSGQIGTFDIRATDNNIILSDGSGAVKMHTNSSGGTTFNVSPLGLSIDESTNNSVRLFFKSSGVQKGQIFYNVDISAAANEFLQISGGLGYIVLDNRLRFDNYGNGTHTGTLAKTLGVDTNGNVIEFTSGNVTVSGASVGNRVAVWNNTTGELRATSAIATENSNIYLVQPSANGTDKFNYIIGGAFAINENDFGVQNTGFGHGVLNGAELTGNFNSSFGVQSQIALTTGSYNTSIGSFAMYDNRSGDYNVGLGAKTMFNQRISNYNVAIGFDSMDGVTASQTAVSDYNTAVGYQSLQLIQGGDNNTVIGKDSGNAITTGSNNVIIGSFTGFRALVVGGLPEYSIITSSNNIVLSDGDGNVRQSFSSNGAATFGSRVTLSSGILTIKNGVNDSNGLKLFQDVSDVSVIENHFSGSMKFNIAGSTKLTISSTGLATFQSSIQEKIKLIASSDEYLSLAFANISGTTQWEISKDNNNGLYFYRGGGGSDQGIKLLITSGGNVGIGGITSPTYRIEANTTSGGNGIKILRGSTSMFEQFQSTTGTVSLAASGTGGTAGSFSFRTGTSVGTTSPRLTISSGGNATFTPSGGSVVIGSNGFITSTQALDAVTAGGRFIGSSSRGILGDIRIEQEAVNADGGYMRFMISPNGSTVPLEKVRISSEGVLKIFGTSTANALSIIHDAGNNVTMSIPFLNVNQDIVVKNATAGVRLDHAATSWVNNSDENIKENIVSLNNVLDKIKDIRCVNYNLKDEEIYKKRLGFIAQDFQKDFGEVVSKSSEGILGLHYTETIPILMKSIQEQQTIIEYLKLRIEKLEL